MRVQVEEGQRNEVDKGERRVWEGDRFGKGLFVDSGV
jgi:hypothetical protein